MSLAEALKLAELTDVVLPKKIEAALVGCPNEIQSFQPSSYLAKTKTRSTGILGHCLNVTRVTPQYINGLKMLLQELIG